ncbi:LLM class flavin-dependent oxidoreductase [Microbacterium betulae]|uniref:LLM class flavin-dependent oxidoreductase n=1 Tax=Microbacterium betulae TaxID=2981139 RepID=A0AA97FJN9_9MICO|nr:LLM class flavin-dependent oxidoreductase [Microbacterium sp. AB]WOF23289.1 LLM class flavin-dependent oxidoreductase [Microbacterium sp. AB]
MTHPRPLIALVGDLPALLRSGDPGLLSELRRAADVVGAVVVGAGGRPQQLDPVAAATSLTVRAPGLPALVSSDGLRDAPYNAARRFLSLDHLSGARSGVVFRSGDGDAERTAERIRVIRALWNSWPVETLLADRERGVYATTDGIRRIEHDGEHYRVAGALNTPTSRQAEPVSLWHVTSEAELAAAGGLVDLVVVDDAALADAWAGSEAEGRPGLVSAGVEREDAALSLVRVESLPALQDVLDAARPLEPGVLSGTLRARLGLPERRYDLTDKPLAFGGAR